MVVASFVASRLRVRMVWHGVHLHRWLWRCHGPLRRSSICVHLRHTGFRQLLRRGMLRHGAGRRLRRAVGWRLLLWPGRLRVPGGVGLQLLKVAIQVLLAPAVHDLVQEIGIVDVHPPTLGERGGAGARQVLFRQPVEANARGQGDALAEGHRLAHAESEMPARRMSWSRSLVSRSENTVLHCERMVGSSSAGRCVMMHNDTPYLRPSLAMREIARRVGSKPALGSFGT